MILDIGPTIRPREQRAGHVRAANGKQHDQWRTSGPDGSVNEKLSGYDDDSTRPRSLESE